MNFIGRSIWHRATILILAVALCGSACEIWRRHRLLQERDALNARLEASSQAIAPRSRLGALAIQPEALDEARRLALSLRQPWERMLDALQLAVKGDVLLTRVQPETDAFRLRVSGQADSSQAFLEFTARLRSDAAWRAVDPLSESLQPEGAPDGKPLAFQLTVEWRRP